MSTAASPRSLTRAAEAWPARRSPGIRVSALLSSSAIPAAK